MKVDPAFRSHPWLMWGGLAVACTPFVAWEIGLVVAWAESGLGSLLSLLLALLFFAIVPVVAIYVTLRYPPIGGFLVGATGVLGLVLVVDSASASTPVEVLAFGLLIGSPAIGGALILVGWSWHWARHARDAYRQWEADQAPLSSENYEQWLADQQARREASARQPSLAGADPPTAMRPMCAGCGAALWGAWWSKVEGGFVCRLCGNVTVGPRPRTIS